MSSILILILFLYSEIQTRIIFKKSFLIFVKRFVLNRLVIESQNAFTMFNILNNNVLSCQILFLDIN